MDISSYNYFFIFSPSLFFPYPYVNNIPKKGKLEKTLGKWGKKRFRFFLLRYFPVTFKL